jgi:hypothetical protein
MTSAESTTACGACNRPSGGLAKRKNALEIAILFVGRVWTDNYCQPIPVMREATADCNRFDSRNR